MARDYFAQITTPYGSVVALTRLTRQEAAAIARVAVSDRPVVDRTEDEDRECPSCGGRGGRLEKIGTRAPGRSIVITDRWVNCRPCAGTGASPAGS